jgi:hypothetical protein
MQKKVTVITIKISLHAFGHLSHVRPYFLSFCVMWAGFRIESKFKLMLCWGSSFCWYNSIPCTWVRMSTSVRTSTNIRAVACFSCDVFCPFVSLLVIIVCFSIVFCRCFGCQSFAHCAGNVQVSSILPLSIQSSSTSSISGGSFSSSSSGSMRRHLCSLSRRESGRLMHSGVHHHC